MCPLSGPLSLTEIVLPSSSHEGGAVHSEMSASSPTATIPCGPYSLKRAELQRRRSKTRITRRSAWNQTDPSATR